jgi:hypothetical protein
VWQRIYELLGDLPGTVTATLPPMTCHTLWAMLRH